MLWKTIPNYPKYEISEHGNVRRISGKVLHNTDAAGYFVVTLFNEDGRRIFRVHRLVAIAFLSAPENVDATQVAHNDGTKKNNHFSNLRWATCRENLSDRIIHGTTLDGIRNGRSKLTEAQVIEIRKRYKKRDPENSAAAMAKEFGVTDVAIIKAYRGENWSSVLMDRS